MGNLKALNMQKILFVLLSLFLLSSAEMIGNERLKEKNLRRNKRFHSRPLRRKDFGWEDFKKAGDLGKKAKEKDWQKTGEDLKDKANELAKKAKEHDWEETGEDLKDKANELAKKAKETDWGEW